MIRVIRAANRIGLYSNFGAWCRVPQISSAAAEDRGKQHRKMGKSRE
jgi:hypothetical protein